MNFSTAVMYFAELDMMKYMQSKSMGVAYVRMPSENAFAMKITTEYFFGMAYKVGSGGLSMDVARNIGMTTALDGDSGKMVRYKLASGMNSSALEHSVPEQLFSTPDSPAQGVSAVKALQIANNQGIPIYTISKDNIASVLPNLQLDLDVIQDIQNAINAGKQVTVSKTNISFNGWNGVGYIITDPITGDGAYMISGGLNGAQIMLGFSIVFFALAIAFSGTVIGALVFAFIGLSFALGALMLMFGKKASDEFMDCFAEVFIIHVGGDKAEQAMEHYEDVLGNAGMVFGETILSVLKSVLKVVLIAEGLSAVNYCYNNLYAGYFREAK